MSQVVNYYLLNIEILEGIRVTYKLRLILDSLLIRLKFLGPPSIAAWTYIVNSLWGYSSRK